MGFEFTEFGEIPAPEVRGERMDNFKRLFEKVFEITKDEHPALTVSVCLTLALNLTMLAHKENIQSTLAAIETMKATLEKELEGL
jgi:hypothetical protein